MLLAESLNSLEVIFIGNDDTRSPRTGKLAESINNWAGEEEEEEF